MPAIDGRLPGPLRRRRARPLVRRVSRLVTALDRRLLRTGRRTIGGRVAGDVPVLLLSTTGRRTGRRRTTPLLFHREDGDHLLLVAANGGADWHPDWLHNLRADPRVSVELDGVGRRCRAHVLDEVERAVAWPTAVRAFPGLAQAQAESSRMIPLVRLTIEG